MFKKSLLVILLFMTNLFSYSTPEWSTVLSGTHLNKDIGFNMDIDDQENIYMVTNKYIDLESYNRDYHIAKINSEGTIEWETSLGFDDLYGVNGGNEAVYAVKSDNNGSIYILGYSYVSGYSIYGSDMILAKFDTNGNQIWMKRISGLDGEAFSPYPWDSDSLAIDSNGNIYFTTTGSNNIGHWTLVFKYDNNGNQIWKQLVSGEYEKENSSMCSSYDKFSSRPTKIVLDSNDTVYVAINSTTGLFGEDTNLITCGQQIPYIASYDSNGILKWYKRILSDGITSIALDKNNDLIVIGDIMYTNRYESDFYGNASDGRIHHYVLKLDVDSEDKNVSWAKIKLGNTSGEAYKFTDILVDKENTIHLTGSYNGSNASHVLYSNNGEYISTKTYGTDSWDYSYNILSNSEGDIFLGGVTYSDTFYDNNITKSDNYAPFVLKTQSTKPVINSITVTGDLRQYKELHFTTDYSLYENRTLESLQYDYLNDGNYTINDTFTYENDGNYTVNVKVIDSEGEITISAKTITINELPYEEMTFEQKLKKAIDPIYYNELNSLIQSKINDANSACTSNIVNNPSILNLYSESDLNSSINNSRVEGIETGKQYVQNNLSEFNLTTIALMNQSINETNTTAYDLGLTTGQNNIINNLSSYSLFTQLDYNTAVSDANISGYNAGVINGQSSVIDNPFIYGLISISDSNTSIQEATNNGIASGTKYVIDNLNEFNLTTIAVMNQNVNETNITAYDLGLTTGQNNVIADPSSFGISVGDTTPTITSSTIDSATTGWTLMGTTKMIDDMSIFDNTKLVWKYTSNGWQVYSPNTQMQQVINNAGYTDDKIINKIDSNQGFWIKK